MAAKGEQYRDNKKNFPRLAKGRNRTTVSLKSEHAKALKHRAVDEGRSVSDILEEILDKAL